MAAIDLNKALSEINIATSLDEKLLHKIGEDAVQGYLNDEESRAEWMDKTAEWMELALQVSKDKSYPWPNASNIRYPLITVAALQFAARAYPSLINTSGSLVKGKIIGDDPDGMKTAQSIRVAKHMTYQILDEMYCWEEHMDKLLLNMAIVGCAFKKTYWSSYYNTNISEYITAKDLVADYFTKSFDDCKRITHLLYFYKNDVVSRQKAGIYLDVNLGEPQINPNEVQQLNPGKALQTPSEEISDFPYTILEQHCYLDLDEDGYEEPYVVTVDLESKKVLRVVARYTADNIIKNDDGAIVRIEPVKYFTKYTFIPNPDGGFYDLGFGLLLGTINEGVNTVLNQLIDAGTLSNLQSGFLSRGIRMKGGNFSFRPGEWKVVNATGADLKQGIFPMPVREPSSVLFQLLGMLVQAAKELSTVSDIMVGKMPGQNTPATTTQTAVEEGQKVFTAIYKRIYRSMAEEFKKLFELNKEHIPPTAGTLPPQPQQQGQPPVPPQPQQGPQIPYIQPGDYQNTMFRIIPAADPNAATDSARLQQATAVMQLIPTGMINPQVAVKNMLEAQQQPNIEMLMNVPPPQPDPELEFKKQELALEQAKIDSNERIANQTAMIAMITAKATAIKAQSDAMLNAAKADTEAHSRNMAELAQQLETFTAMHDKAAQLVNEETQKQQQHHQQVMDVMNHNSQQQLARDELIRKTNADQMKNEQAGQALIAKE